MPRIDKKLLRLAMAVGAQFGSRHDPLLELPQNAWDRCAQLVRQIRRAQLRGWNLAAQELRTDLRYTLAAIQGELTALHSRLPAAIRPDPVTSAHDIYRDLVALQQEFECVDFDCRASWLSVTTEPIELQGIYLGPFEVRLDVRRIQAVDSSPYRVIATDPHPAESRDNVTHPHVMDQVLCEGDGRQAIRQALAQGRLLDFFTLIAGVMRNYNPESPFVELALWHGHACSDCGSSISDDDSYSCHRCGESVCGECEICCTRCENSCCSSCAANCPGCESLHCQRCLIKCAACRASTCPNCLDDDERCPNCHEEDEEQLESVAEDNLVAVQPHGLGQAAISTGCG
jgi:hypothetical protein